MMSNVGKPLKTLEAHIERLQCPASLFPDPSHPTKKPVFL